MTLFDDEGPPPCRECGGKRRIWSQRVGDYIPCPRCAANEGIQRTDNALDENPEWRRKAEWAFRDICLRMQFFSMDDVHTHFDRIFPGVTTHVGRDERRRWGAVAKYAVKEEWCVTDGVVFSERRHRAPIMRYRSLLWNG